MALRQPERRGSVGWVFIGDTQTEMENEGFYAAHAVAEQLDEFRRDPGVRAVVLTGQEDGQFYRLNPRSHWDDPRFKDRLNPLKRRGGIGGGGGPSAHETLLNMEKPVICRLNGDAIGFGSSVIWLCDVIVGREDARVAWGFQGMGQIEDSDGELRGMPWAITPTYGTYSFPLMSPPVMKEFVMLSRVYTARELADMRLINYAVPTGELDDLVDRVVEGFLARPSSVLAHTKRIINKHLVDEYVKVEDLAAAYSQLDLWEQGASGAMD
ncbi:MAG TPA: enoyl-CoA hydratase/isomerase family protein [Acidimicrobiales bacterium]|nr:enoyl-CoA hydratase/isomerase family protein [Acidimicrobiales bacterium]